jgi:lipopolysaccharide transport system permease protein
MNNKHWDTIIDSKSQSFKLVELWNYRDLLLLLVKRDLTSFYKQTIFGPIWFFVQPILTTITFSFIFGNLAGLSTDKIPQPLFYMLGINIWTFFSDTLIKNSTIFKDNASLFGKVYFPRLLISLSIVTSNLLKFSIQLILFFTLYLYFYIFQNNNSINVTYHIFLFPISIIILSLLSLGLGLIISALTNKYKDLSFLLIFGIQLFMYSTPVIYPLNSLPKSSQWILLLNPVTEIIETSRLGILGAGYFNIFSYSYSILFSIFVLLLGIMIFNKVEKNFIDKV